jgi:CHAT domain-containing protein
MLSNLASYYSYLGNYNEAIQLGTEALNIEKRVLGKENSNYATMLSNLAGYYSDLGNYSEAIRLDTEALNIEKRVLGKENSDYATSLNNIALYNAYMGNYTEAIRLGTEALNIYEQFYGKEHPKYASSLCNLAGYYSYLGNYSEAIRLGTEALNIRERILGKDHPDYATSLNSLAGYYSYCMNYYTNAILLGTEAIRLGTEALNIYEQFYGKEHPDYANTLNSLANYYLRSGNIEEGEQYKIEYSELVKDFVCKVFPDLTSHERSLYWNKYKYSYLTETPFISYTYKAQALLSTAYSSLLFGKGLLLNAETELRKTILDSGNEDAINAIDELKINRLMLNKQLGKPISDRTLSTDSLNKVISGLEHKLLTISKEYGDYTKNLRIDVKDVQAKLTTDDIAVEFASFVDNDTTIYCAYLLKPEYESPKMKVCLKQTDQDVFVDAYSKKDLSKAIWGTLADELQGVKNIYFAPSGELYNIAIESLPDWEDSTKLVSDRLNFYRLSSTRELALIKDKNQIKKSVVYGGLKYDTDSATIVRDSKKYRSLDLTVFSSSIADSLNLRDGVADLPGTKIEANAIDSKLRAVKIDDIVRTDTIGTEASFKALSGQKKNLLHIATHGFYWTETEAKDAANLSFLLGNDEKRYQEDKALTRSGLLFAGANNALKGQPLPDGVDDGILTAQEISQLDLRGLDLVVLSACETGLGEITGDGVFGLQRGFKKAGAQSIMMSLWKVDDEATQMLMTQFYTNLTSGKSKRQSLLDAQRYLREYEVEETVATNGNLTPFQKKQLEKQGKSIEQKTETKLVRPYSDPRYWAAFILLDAID